MKPARSNKDSEAVLTIRPAEHDRWNDIVEVFGSNGATEGCWCMYWRLPSGPEYDYAPLIEPAQAAMSETVQELGVAMGVAMLGSLTTLVYRNQMQAFTAGLQHLRHHHRCRHSRASAGAGTARFTMLHQGEVGISGRVAGAWMTDCLVWRTATA